MNVIYSFRLTRVLYDQVRKYGCKVCDALENWEEKDYLALCGYISQCSTIVPKYVAMIAEHQEEAPREIVRQILECQTPMLGLIKKAAGQEPSFVTHLPEDKADTSRFIQSYCEDAKRYM